MCVCTWVYRVCNDVISFRSETTIQELMMTKFVFLYIVQDLISTK